MHPCACVCLHAWQSRMRERINSYITYSNTYILWVSLCRPACFCASICGILCPWVIKPVCVWERAKKLWKASRGISSERESFSPPPLRVSLLPSFPLSLSPPNTQSSQRREREVKEELEDQQAAWQFAAPCASVTCGKPEKNGNDFSCFSIKTTHCHVDVLPSTSVVDALNMASLSAQSPGRLSGGDYQDQKWKNFLPDRGETPAKMVKFYSCVPFLSVVTLWFKS